MSIFYGIPIEYNGVTNVQDNFDLYFDLLTNKCCNLFKWEGLPETVNERFLMMQLILTGRIAWFADKGNIYALNGSWGGEPNCYYEPTQWIVANPVLGSKTLTVRNMDGSDSIDKLDGIVMGLTDVDLIKQNPTKGGLYRLIYQTAGLLADNISSLNVSQINGRVSQIWTADNDAMSRTVEEIMRDIYEGHPYRVVSQDILNKVNSVPSAQTGQSNTLLNLIEAHQYILASFYNEIGLPSNWNMKRERINTAETELMTGSLDVSIYNMEKNLQAAVEKINELFGTSISVRFNEEIKEEEAEVEGEEVKTEEEEVKTEEEETPVEEDETVIDSVEEKKNEEKEAKEDE